MDDIYKCNDVWCMDECDEDDGGEREKRLFGMMEKQKWGIVKKQKDHRLHLSGTMVYQKKKWGERKTILFFFLFPPPWS